MAYSIYSGDEDLYLTVLYGCRTCKDILFKDDFDKISAKTDKVKVIYVLSDEKVEDFENEFITAILIKKYAGNDEYSIFASGPQAMYRFLDKEVEKLGIVAKFYRKELFYSAKEPWMEKGILRKQKTRFSIRTLKCARI